LLNAVCYQLPCIQYRNSKTAGYIHDMLYSDLEGIRWLLFTIFIKYHRGSECCSIGNVDVWNCSE